VVRVIVFMGFFSLRSSGGVGGRQVVEQEGRQRVSRSSPTAIPGRQW